MKENERRQKEVKLREEMREKEFKLGDKEAMGVDEEMIGNERKENQRKRRGEETRRGR